MISLNNLNDLLKSFFELQIETNTHKILFTPPLKSNTSTDDKTLINIYLFDIRENIEYKANKWEFTRDETSSYKQKPLVMLDMFYMVSIYGASTNVESRTEEELTMLSYLLPLVYNKGYLSKEDFAEFSIVSLFEQLPDDFSRLPIEPIHPKFLDEQGGFQVWSSFEQHLKPAIYLKVTAPITFDTFKGANIVKDKKVILKEDCN